MQHVKCVIVGDACVGKSAMVVAYAGKEGLDQTVSLPPSIRTQCHLYVLVFLFVCSCALSVDVVQQSQQPLLRVRGREQSHHQFRVWTEPRQHKGQDQLTSTCLRMPTFYK